MSKRFTNFLILQSNCLFTIDINSVKNKLNSRFSDEEIRDYEIHDSKRLLHFIEMYFSLPNIKNRALNYINTANDDLNYVDRTLDDIDKIFTNLDAFKKCITDFVESKKFL